MRHTGNGLKNQFQKAPKELLQVMGTIMIQEIMGPLLDHDLIEGTP